MYRGPKQTFTDGQQTHEKMLNITNHQGNKNQNHNEISIYSSNSGSLKRQAITRVGKEVLEKDTLVHCVMFSTALWKTV